MANLLVARWFGGEVTGYHQEALKLNPRSNYYLDLFFENPKVKSSALFVISQLVCLWP